MFHSRRNFLRATLVSAGSLLMTQYKPDRVDSPTARAQSTTAAGTNIAGSTAAARYLDPMRSPVERVDDLVSRMTLAEKVSQLSSVAPAIERLGIPEYNWWNEALHGVARAGLATVFPQVIGLASTWNTDLIYRVAETIADEARAKHHEAVRSGVRDLYTGLTFFAPNVNIFRDPRWGRGQETYGEDPYLTAQLAVNFIQGLQGDDPDYLKTVATPKHFAVHSGPEKQRHSFNAVVSPTDLQMTYLPAFKACITEGKAASIMGAYNRVNGEACCASPTLLQEILRETWGFDGYVVSDCGAVDDIYRHHRLVDSAVEAAALAINTGCDLECGCSYGIPCDYGGLIEAVQQGLVTEDTLDRAVKRLLTARFRLGMFDPAEQVPYSQIPYAVVDSPAHRELALEAARQSLVLLKNQDNLLPLNQARLRSIAVIGPNAAETLVLTGNYMGTPAAPVSVLEGIRALVAPATQVNYARGCELIGASQADFAQAVAAAKQSEVAVVVVGLSQQLEGEEGQVEGNPPGVFSLGDRTTINLPYIQEKLMRLIYGTGTPVILVLINGSALAINWADAHVPAILEAWYPGQAGGTAIAEAIFGLTNPGGRLPVTFYRSLTDLPPFADYRMANRTYRYFTGQPLYPFGFGLSYTTFTYHDLQITPATVQSGQPVTVQVVVENRGPYAGDEVVQLYLQDLDATQPIPRLQLQGFTRIHLLPDAKQLVQFTLTANQMSFADADGNWVLEPGQFNVWVGGQQPNLTAHRQPANILAGQFILVR